MSMQSSAGRAEWVNEELCDYEGFVAISSLLERTARDQEDLPKPELVGLDAVRAVMMPATDEERAAQEAVISAIIEHPEMADLVQRLQDVNEARRSRIVCALFPSPEIDRPEQE